MFSYSLHSTVLLAMLFISAAALPSSVRAQRSGATDSISIDAQRLVSVPLAPAAAKAAGSRVSPVGIGRLAQPNAPALAQSRDQGAHIGAGSNLALMGTGGAGVIVGLLVGGSGGTAIALGGGIVGLVGLYRYLR